MHVALGVQTDSFPVGQFLGGGTKRRVTVDALGSSGEQAVLQFASNPARRGGEWLIRDQYTHRHPAWSTAAGFPKKYLPHDPPYLFLARVNGKFYARFAVGSRIRAVGGEVTNVLSRPKGIHEVSQELLALLSIENARTILAEFQSDEAAPSEPFNPNDVADGRQKIISAIFRRLGQQAFRRRLFSAYVGQCAISRCTTKWVLEAAHITPYRGLRTNAVDNGLLLRADIHTLFDLGLISINPQRLQVCVSKRLKTSEYARFDGKDVLIPTRKHWRPSVFVLKAHYDLFVPQ